MLFARSLQGTIVLSWKSAAFELSTLNPFPKAWVLVPKGPVTPPFLTSSVPRDLAPRDISGTSDPFARVFWGSQSLETSVSGGAELGDWGIK